MNNNNQQQAQPNPLESLAQQFTAFYYPLFTNKDKSNLGALLSDQSTFTWETKFKATGKANILNTLTQLPLVQMQPDSIDVQPCGAGMLLFVTGKAQIEGQQQVVKFAQAFTLLPNPANGGFFVLNDIFRLNYG